MIILARPVAYGGNAARYAMEKEDATVVKVNHMPDYLDATEIWYRMKHHCQLHQQDRTVGRKLERFMTTFVLSPSKEESENYTLDDWANLADEGLEALDSVGLFPKGFKEKVKTNFRNSMSVAALHRDSKSGTLHLHLDCCRVDNDGTTNDVHDLRMRGYEVNPRYDTTNCKLVGYTIGKNASVFKASAIGRKFMVSQLEATWKKMHPKPTQVKMRPASPSVSPARPARHVAQTTKPTQSNSKPLPVATKTAFNVNVSGEMKRIYIPNTVKDIFLNEVQVPDSDMTASREDISHVGMLLFLDMIDAATTVSESCGGGGSAPSSGWGKDDDEDERERARRCLQMAHAMCKPPQKRRSFHR